MESREVTLLCKNCKNYWTEKDYYSGYIRFHCKQENKDKNLRCNKENYFYAYEEK